MEKEDIRGLIIGEPSFAGLVGLSNTAFTLRVTFTTLPLKQWTVRFALDTMVKNISIWRMCARRCRPIRYCLRRAVPHTCSQPHLLARNRPSNLRFKTRLRPALTLVVIEEGPVQ